MLPVAGHGAGLRPELLSSVEPIGMPGFEVAGVEALDCKDVALPVAEAPPHVVVTGPAEPGSVAPVMIPTPLLSNSAVELGVPVMALPMPGLEHAVAEATPLEVPEVTPGVASGAGHENRSRYGNQAACHCALPTIQGFAGTRSVSCLSPCERRR
jgi:hypothetical protein